METYKYDNKGILSTPNIHLNVASGECTISGNSFVENIQKFYQPLFDWVDAYTQQKLGDLIWDIKVRYFNSSSQKAFALLLRKLSNYQQNGGKVTINWHYLSGDEDLLEDIEYFSEVSGLTINLLAHQRSTSY